VIVLFDRLGVIIVIVFSMRNLVVVIRYPLTFIYIWRYKLWLLWLLWTIYNLVCQYIKQRYRYNMINNNKLHDHLQYSCLFLIFMLLFLSFIFIILITISISMSNMFFLRFFKFIVFSTLFLFFLQIHQILMDLIMYHNFIYLLLYLLIHLLSN